MVPGNIIAPEIHLNLNVRGMKRSATLAINERCAELKAQGKQIFRMGLGQSPFPVPAHVVEELQTWGWRKEYLPVQGLPLLREAVAAYHSRQDGVECQARDVLIGPGSKELMFLLQVAYHGDLVIPAPSWVSYAPQAQILGRRVRFINTRVEDDWKLLPEQLDDLCAEDPNRPRFLILNYPNNPTGVSYTADELQQLAEVAERHRLFVLSDEIYGEVHHDGKHRSLASFYPQGTVISSGLSKWCGAGGWRLGTFTFPPSLRPLLEAMATVASESYTSTSTPIQCAAVRAFEYGPEMKDYLKHSRRVLKAVSRVVCQKLEGCGARVAQPHGGFYAFPDFTALTQPLAARGIRNSHQFCTRLLEDTGVAILPGSDFGRPPEELTARLAFVNFDGTRALLASEEAAMDSLDDAFVAQRCSAVVEAVERISAWVMVSG